MTPRMTLTMENMNALRLLERLTDARNDKKYPSIPGYGRKRSRFNDQTSNDLTQAILAAFKVHGIFATRLDSKGTYNAALGKFIPSRQRKGMPDISALLHNGKAVFVEVKCKATRDRLRPDQETTIAELKKNGAHVFIAQDFQSFWEWLTDLIVREGSRIELDEHRVKQEVRVRTGHEKMQ